MILIFIGFALITICLVGYAFTHPVRTVVSLAKYLCIIAGLVLLFFTLTVGTELGTAWLAIGVILTAGAFFAANRLSALRNNI
ncbi:MAG: hypothetical protein H9W81_05735 [Enterococcus sp.]|nr:hypothetical protein [Enterococcus sp.]